MRITTTYFLVDAGHRLPEGHDVVDGAVQLPTLPLPFQGQLWRSQKLETHSIPSSDFRKHYSIFIHHFSSCFMAIEWENFPLDKALEDQRKDTILLVDFEYSAPGQPLMDPWCLRLYNVNRGLININKPWFID